MIYFLRDKNNHSIIECSVYDNDLHTNVNIREYTMGLFDKVAEVIVKLNYLSIMRLIQYYGQHF